MHLSAYERRSNAVKDMIRVVAALADPTRLRLVRLLLREELCVCELVDALRIPQYKVSRHLRRLRAAGLVEATRRGRWMHYRIRRVGESNRVQKSLLRVLIAHLKDMPEMKRDDERLGRRLGLRRSGECVVGNMAR
jgi:ArsR family transcriptional regulator